MLTDAEKQAVRLKRTETLVGVWDILVATGKLDGAAFKLSTPLVNEVIEHYIADLEVMKLRYKIHDLIHLHKVAGLMTGAIMRFRPVIPIGDEYPSEISIYANEIMAIYHGIAICGQEVERNERMRISTKAWFANWMKDFIYLLHHRNHNPESLIFIYETLCYSHFPSSFTNGESLSLPTPLSASAPTA